MNPVMKIMGGVKIIQGKAIKKIVVKKIEGKLKRGVIVKDRTGKNFIGDTYWCVLCNRPHTLGIGDEFEEHLNDQSYETRWAVVSAALRGEDGMYVVGWAD